MKTNQAGLDLIKQFESCRLIAYPDPGTGGDPWTIGWGTTGPNVYAGLQISQEQADLWLAEDVSRFEICVGKAIIVPVTDNQFAACVSLAYNVGCAAFQRSTLVKRINSEMFDEAAEQFMLWNRSGGKVMAGLTRRRAAERELFLS